MDWTRAGYGRYPATGGLPVLHIGTSQTPPGSVVVLDEAEVRSVLRPASPNCLATLVLGTTRRELLLERCCGEIERT